MNILLLDNYDSFTYNLVHRLREVGGEDVTVVRNDEFNPDDLKNYTHLVLSPGPGIPSEAGRMMEVIHRSIRSMPILGVCLGHQALAEYSGGTLKNLSEVVHGKETPIHQTSETSRLFRGLPKVFTAGRYHSWVVHREGLPKDLEVAAVSEDGEIMAFEHRTLPVFGVQFHPESVMTKVGHEILHNWLAV